MPLATEENLLTLDAGLAHFKAVYMPARNYSRRTREEYESDLSDLISFLTARNLTAWPVVGLRDLQSYLADLDRRGLAPASRNRKTYTIKTFFGYLHQAGYLKKNSLAGPGSSAGPSPCLIPKGRRPGRPKRQLTRADGSVDNSPQRCALPIDAQPLPLRSSAPVSGDLR